MLAVLSLHCCAWSLSSCRKQGLLSSCGVWASHCSGFSFFFFLKIFICLCEFLVAAYGIQFLNQGSNLGP